MQGSARESHALITDRAKKAEWRKKLEQNNYNNNFLYDGWGRKFFWGWRVREGLDLMASRASVWFVVVSSFSHLFTAASSSNVFRLGQASVFTRAQLQYRARSSAIITRWWSSARTNSANKQRNKCLCCAVCPCWMLQLLCLLSVRISPRLSLLAAVGVVVEVNARAISTPLAISTTTAWACVHCLSLSLSSLHFTFHCHYPLRWCSSLFTAHTRKFVFSLTLRMC